MPELEKRFTNAFGRLCHFIAIRNDTASVTAAEDGVIRAAIYLCENGLAPDVNEISENVKAFFSLSFSEQEIQGAINRLAASRQVTRRANGAISLSADALADIQRCLQASSSLESEVRAEWMTSLNGAGLLPGKHTEDEIWFALQKYLAALFTRHGVQTLEVLSPSSVVDSSVDLPASDILDSVIKDYLPKMSLRDGRRLLQAFLRDRTSLRNRYLSELLDGTFSFFALTVDDDTRRLLQQNLPPLKLFVDTNFIFGLLDLHSNPFVATSKQLADVIRTQKFPFQLYYHPITATEFRSVIDYYHKRLSGGKWSPSMSRALLSVGELSSVERKFHEINADQPISADDFFARYSNLDRLLTPVNVLPFRAPYESILNDEETLNLISKYKQYLGDREKTFGVMQHDIVLWRTLHTVRQNHPGPFGAGAFFLTCDYTFWRFDHRELSRSSAGISVLPNVFLQLLRPFVTRTDDFDRSFVSTFALPEFRTIHSASAQAVSRVAGIVRLYADLPDDVAIAILTDDALIAKVTKLDETDPTINELIESAIAAEASRWQSEALRLREQLDNATASAQNNALALSVATTSAEEKVRALAAVERQFENERANRLSAEANLSAQAERYAEENAQQNALIEDLTRRVEEAEAVAVTTKTAAGEQIRHFETQHSAQLRHVKQILYALLHLAGAFATYSLLLRYASLSVKRHNALVIGLTVYALAAAAAELTPWFAARAQRRLVRLLWTVCVLSGVIAAWCEPHQGAAFALWIGIFASALVALICFLFGKD